jgi:hypothetical protein
MTVAALHEKIRAEDSSKYLAHLPSDIDLWTHSETKKRYYILFYLIS